jgi:hypothetical protein
MKNENCYSSAAPINWELRRHNIICLFCSTAFGFAPSRFGWTARPKIASAFSKKLGRTHSPPDHAFRLEADFQKIVEARDPAPHHAVPAPVAP